MRIGKQSTEMKLFGREVIGRNEAEVLCTGGAAISLSYSFTPFSALTPPTFFSPINDGRQATPTRRRTDAKNRNKANMGRGR